MNKLITALLALCLGFSIYVSAQNTVGLLSYYQPLTSEGYNLIYPHNQSHVFLLNNCGEIVHEWPDEDNFRPGNTAFLTEDGMLYKAKRDAVVTGDAIWAGGGGAIIEIRDWDNNLVYSFEMNDDQNRLHHDFAVKENGNIIALAWELIPFEECVAAGRDTTKLAQNKIWSDWIFEIDIATDSIVWEWHAWDHLIQDFDSTKNNYGVIADHPELIDLNYARDDGHPDWMHGNALDFRDDESQILLSVPYYHEVWIIDQTTSTEEAAGNFGGFSDRGGDLMYRWGNPAAYDSGDSTDQKLFFQHDAHWVDDFVSVAHPHYNNIAVFNNRVGADYSTANMWDPKWDMYTWAFQETDGVFEPEEFDLTLTHPERERMWSTGLSSVQALENGNFLLSSGRFGYSFEMTPNSELVWEYRTPTIGSARATQGDTLVINNNLTFRFKRYPLDFMAFNNKDLSPKGWIELMPNEEFCDELTDIEDLVMQEEAFKLYPNPTSEYLAIEWDGMIYADIEAFDMLGKKVYQKRCNGGREYVDVSLWDAGVYIISFVADNSRYSRKLVISD